MLAIRRTPRSYATFLGLITAGALALGTISFAASADAASYSLAVSTQSDRSSAQSLAGATYASSAKIYVFLTRSSGLRRVQFYLDGTAHGTDFSVPFDFNGTAVDGNANPFDVSTLSLGEHRITAVVERNNGTKRSVSTTFTVTAAEGGTTNPTEEGDTTGPTAAELSGTAGDGQVTLDWTASTDESGIARYEVWRDNGYVAGVSSSTLSYTNTGLTNGQSYTYRVVAYDPHGNHTNSNSVTATPTLTTATECAAFPSRLKVSGRSLVDANGCVMPKLKGFNMHVGPGFTWSQSHFDAIATKGGKVNRAVLHWDQFEPEKGVVNSTALANLDLHIDRAAAAGLYTQLELHLNVNRTPSWAAAVSETESYRLYGQTLTQALAARYASNPAVLGFGLNEPPLHSEVRNSDPIPYLEGVQRQMISWFRAKVPSWIGFVAMGWASATPLYDDSWQNTKAADASPTAYDSVGRNVVLDVHDYVIGCTNDDPDCDGRQWNGMTYSTLNGGPLLGTGEATGYTSTQIRRSQQAAYLKPYKTFSESAPIPVMVGEWGWPQGPTSELEWIADKKLAWANLGPVIEIHWNYDVTESNTRWAARPGGVWRPSVSDWLAP